MPAVRPQVVVLAGPNGAGKTTVAGGILPRLLEVYQFVNADAIASGLAGYDPESASIAAGRIMLQRIRELVGRCADFAFETTLATRGFAPLLRPMAFDGYRVHIVFLWLPSAQMALARVQDRRRRGGHSVPAEVVRRRYIGGLRNFFTLYRSIADSWRFYDNSGAVPRLIAERFEDGGEQALDFELWERLVREGTS